MPNLTIDGKQIEVPAGTTIIQAADKLGINIPRYCYHPALPVSGNCRICMVEVEKQPKLQIACYTPVADGMVVKTNSPKVLEVRKTVLEFLLVNHPVDCPVCDQAGECKLQDYYMEHGQYDSRLSDVKVKKEKKAFSIGPTVMLDQERCILCTRCVRFADTITKTSEFGVFSRGDHSQLDVYPGKQLDNSYSGNVVDICPVGALTDTDFRFKCRVWYLAQTKSVCPGCSMGCNITVEWDKMRPHQHKKARVMRLKPRHNPEVNDYWICDKGRYNYRFIDENRIQHPQLNNDLISWDRAIDTIVTTLKPLKDLKRTNRIGVIASAQLTNEDLFVIRKFFKETLKGAHVDFRVPEKPGDSDDFLIKADKNPNTAGALNILQPDVDAAEIVKKARAGEIDVLYVFGQDLVTLFGKEALYQISKNVKLFVYQGSNVNDTCGYAHLNLPSSVYAEKEGTFTNCQQKVQRIWPAFLPMAEAKGDWEILSLLSAKLGSPLTYKHSPEVFKDIAATIPSFPEMTYEKLSDKGMILKSMNDILIKFILSAGTLFIMFNIAGLLTWVERKQSAVMQDRIGANRASIFGLKAMGMFHALADVLKMLSKEEFIPDGANKFLFNLAPYLSVIFALVGFAAIPIGGALVLNDHVIQLQAANLNIALIFIFAMMSMGVYGVVLAGFSSNNNYAFLGGMRGAAQMIAYEITMGAAIMGVIMVFNTLDLQALDVAQGAYMLGGWVPKWGVFVQPLAFFLFMTAATAETKRTPFDLPEGESEIIGYFVEYSGMKFGMFFLADLVETVLVAALMTTLFFGGWQVPYLHPDGFYFPWGSHIAMANLPVVILGVLAFFAKVAFFIWFLMAVRWTLPRFRYDQLMNLGWKILLPVSLINIFITAVVITLMR